MGTSGTSGISKNGIVSWSVPGLTWAQFLNQFQGWYESRIEFQD